MKKTRRQFLKKTGLAAGIIINPFKNIYPITKKVIYKNPIVGHGDFKYKVDRNWGVQDPSKFPVNDCHEMVLDKKNRIFMTNEPAFLPYKSTPGSKMSETYPN